MRRTKTGPCSIIILARTVSGSSPPTLMMCSGRNHNSLQLCILRPTHSTVSAVLYQSRPFCLGTHGPSTTSYALLCISASQCY
ncbi:hypothetical protein BD289DRAFT_51949 [Coniella lustricola]|uniref:Uncharacterized protein n=1 Tax=Coniella lustricola TaxID=2025994 RepID=A0A2T3A161_9PEZI|nr:hypothetical protein BD289DRAFT_51949 [Coniella lustricola]